MIQLYKMAFRNLGRNRRRSFFSALALGIGLSLLLLMSSVVSGEMNGALDTSIKLNSGHLQVTSKTYDENKASLAWEDLVEDPATLTAQISSLDPVKVATPRLFASGIITSGEESVGARIIGIDPTSTANQPFKDGLLSGEWLTSDDRSGILVGQALADKLELKTGDNINLLANTSNGEVDQQPFTVRGIYTTHTPAFDQGSIFMPLAKAQAITQTENHASTIFVLLKDKAQTAAVASALQSGQYQVKTWEQMNELVVAFEGFANSYMSLLYMIILAITATVIVNTLIMSVFERTREIGILSAIGMRSGRIMGMFFAESSLLAVGGIVIGLVLGGAMMFYFANYGIFIGNMGISGIMLGERIYALPKMNDVVTLSIVTFIVTLLAALYPALLAARMEPVEALHGGK
jgi:ABC-type lipoprotein release transport system permease subunit